MMLVIRRTRCCLTMNGDEGFSCYYEPGTSVVGCCYSMQNGIYLKEQMNGMNTHICIVLEQDMVLD